MSTSSEELIKDFHKKFAVECYNKTWDLIDKKDRNSQDNIEMIHLAHSSRYHWGEIGKPINFERGEWQIARVYAELGMVESSLLHANNCLDICIENNIGDFDIAFAYESLTRAYKLSENEVEYEKNKKLALECGEKISDEEDKKYFLSEMKSL